MMSSLWSQGDVGNQSVVEVFGQLSSDDHTTFIQHERTDARLLGLRGWQKLRAEPSYIQQTRAQSPRTATAAPVAARPSIGWCLVPLARPASRFHIQAELKFPRSARGLCMTRLCVYSAGTIAISSMGVSRRVGRDSKQRSNSTNVDGECRAR